MLRKGDNAGTHPFIVATQRRRMYDSKPIREGHSANEFVKHELAQMPLIPANHILTVLPWSLFAKTCGTPVIKRDNISLLFHVPLLISLQIQIIHDIKTDAGIVCRLITQRC